MRYLTQLAFWLLLTTCSAAFGWGQHGHSLIASIADQLLDANSKTAVQSLLGKESLAQASLWPDRMRGSSENPRFWSYEYSSNWHFINIPHDQSYEQSPLNPRGDIYSALLTFTAILRDETAPDNAVTDGMMEYTRQQLYSQHSKTTALKFVLHLIADIHQPLHVGYPEDRGGNDIHLNWPDSPDNLHSLWDSHLSNIDRLSVPQHRKQLDTLVTSMNTQASKDQTPLDWMNESLLLRQKAYDLPQSADDRKQYLEQNSTLAERQMVLAGIRTAAWLNNIFKTSDPGKNRQP